MDVAGTAVGIASLGIQVCQTLLNYYDGWRQYSDDIATTLSAVERLNAIFADIKTVLAHIDRSTSKHALTAIEACQENLTILEQKTLKLQSFPQPTGPRQKIIAQLQRAWYPLRKSTLVRLQEIVTDIQDQLVLSLELMQVDASITLEAKLSEATEQISRVHLATEKISLQNEQTLELLQSDLFEKAIRWLNAADSESHYRSALATREQGTGSWLVDSATYSQWKSGSIRHLWLYGKAGCGKSVISATIVEDVRRYSRDLMDTQCAMFYFVFDDTSKQSYKDCLASVIAQISSTEPALTMVLQAYQSMKANPPKQNDLEKILLAVIDSQESFTLILDGLDESPEYSTSGQALRQDMLLGLGQLSQKAPKLKILATSRHLIDIEDQMDQMGALSQSMLVEFISKDIRQYVITQLSADSRLNTLGQSIKDEIENELAAKSDGMFRWAYCQMQELRSLQSTRPSRVQAVIKSLPATLDETYYRMLKRIQPQLFDDAIILLRWMAYSKRPLSLQELNETVLIDLEIPGGSVAFHDRGNIRDVLKILSGLVVTVTDSDNLVDLENLVAYFDYQNSKSTRKSNQHIRTKIATSDPISEIRIKLAHLSVKEYLESSRIVETNAHAFHLRGSHEESIITNSCLVYLTHYVRNKLRTGTKKDLVSFPLLQYAAKYWPKHYQDGINTQSAITFLQAQKNVSSWTTLHRPDQDWWEPFDEHYKSSESADGLYYASYLGFYPVVKALIESGTDINNTKGGQYGTPLSAASAKGHEAIANLLVKHNADIDAHGGAAMITPLQIASFRGQVQIATMLIQCGADVNKPGNGYVGTAVYAAACSGNETIFDMLISRGADIEATNIYHGTALVGAIDFGHETIVRKLINLKANLHVRDGHNRTVLAVAAIHGQERIVRRLIEQHGADVNEQSGRCGTALIAASMANMIHIVDLLILKYNADVNMQSGTYGTAVIAAAVGGHTRLVKKLIEDHHANINLYACGIYKTALIGAAIPGHKEVMKLLIEHGADIHAIDDEGRTVLHRVVRCGYLDIFDQLLNTGKADLNLVDNHGKSVLDYACISGDLDLVARVLHLTREARLLCGPKSLWSPLHWAFRSGSGSFKLVALLQSAGEMAGSVTTDEPPASWTPLDIAIYHNNLDLLPTDGDLEYQHRPNNTADQIIGSDLDFASNELFQLRANMFRPAVKEVDRYCDGCLSAIYGPYYRCQTCYDVDYCFMCKAVSKTTHPPHFWSHLLPSNDHDYD